MHGAGRGRCWLMKHAIFRSSDAPSVEGEGRQGCLHFVPGALAYHHFSKGAAVFPLLGRFFRCPLPFLPEAHSCGEMMRGPTDHLSDLLKFFDALWHGWFA